MGSCADGLPTQQLKTAKLLSPGSLAWTNLVALLGLVPAAEKPQGLGFRLSRFLRLWVGGLSRRLLSLGFKDSFGFRYLQEALVRNTQPKSIAAGSHHLNHGTPGFAAPSRLGSTYVGKGWLKYFHVESLLDLRHLHKKNCSGRFGTLHPKPYKPGRWEFQGGLRAG